MKKIFISVFSLFQLAISPGVYSSNNDFEIEYANDNEVVYKVLENEENKLWHWDVKKSSGVPLAVAKPYIDKLTLSYKKINTTEVYTKKSANEANCELWLYSEGSVALVTKNSVCDTNVISHYENKLYIPLRSIAPSADGSWDSKSLISYDLTSKKIQVEFEREQLSGLDPFSSYTITDIQHLSNYTFIKLMDGFTDYTRVIKLDNSHQNVPEKLLEGYDDSEAGLNVIVTDKLYISKYSGYSTTSTSLFVLNESLNELEEVLSLIQYDFGSTRLYSHKGDLLAMSSSESGGRGLFRVLDDGSMSQLNEFQENIQETYFLNEQIYFTTSQSPFGNAIKLGVNYNTKVLFELISYNRSLVVADNILYFFGDDSNLGIYNQEEQSIDLVTLPSLVELPEISGSPTTTINANENYEFTPVIYDPLSIPLELKIENKPSWVNFDTATGRITGSPDGVGVYDNIVISVSNGYMEASLSPFSIEVLEVKQPDESNYSSGSMFYILFIFGFGYLLRRIG